MIVTSAQIIATTFKRSPVFRIGGDEFFALMRNVSEISQVERKAKDLLSTVNKVGLSYPQISVSGSIGISLYPGNGRTLDELYAKADTALYDAKRGGKNQFVFAK